MGQKIKKAATRLGAVAALALMSTSAFATEGYFQLGFGPRMSAVGGAGVADSTDAMAQTLNPAGIAGMGKQLQVGATAFMPYRGYDATGAGFVSAGEIESDKNFFVVPNIAYTRPINEHSTFGFSIYGNGGMNTTYATSTRLAPDCGPFGGAGVFCAGKSGVDLMQAFISGTYAYDFGNGVKLGVAPTMVVQRFKADGLGAFSGVSTSNTNLTNNGYDYSIGGGLRGGVEIAVAEGVRLGLSGQTKMYMQKFEDYAGLFAEQGDFDIPASVTAGIAFDATPELTLMFDYQHIFYSGVKAVSNSSAINPLDVNTHLGSNGGAGFGWDDVNVFKIGAEWNASEVLTLRAGYGYSTNPVNSADVTFNILAPGIVKHHITAGGEYKIDAANSIEFAGMYVPESTVSGPEVTPTGVTPNRVIKLNMHQYQFGAGWKHNF